MKMILFYKTVVPVIIILFTSNSLFAQKVALTGTVRNNTEALPLATVSLAGQSLLTDKNGHFSFSVDTGKYIISITHAGYNKIERQVFIEAGIPQSLEFIMIANDELEEVTMLDSRSLTKRNIMKRAVPIDIFSAKQLQQTGQINLTNMLTFIAPSFNASREVLHEPATLRGLDPQHVLILLNNTRYHNMAWFFGGNLKGQLGKGSVGNDLNSIPFSAIEEIEVLRDGASAQYGSDAIGGIINIKLKKTTGKTSIHLNTGQFYNKDGDKLFFGLYHGISLRKKMLHAEKGFLGIAANYRYQEPTYRGGAYQGTVYYDTANKTVREKDSLLILENQKVAQRGFNRRAAVDNIGNSKVISYGLSINGGYHIKSNTQFFWTAALNERILARIGAYRFPKFSQEVNHFLYPDGFKPTMKTNGVDATLIGGIKGENKKSWHWNISSSYGINSLKSHSSNSNNPTQTFILGSNAQTSFYNGNDIYKLLTTGINFSKQYNKQYGQLKLLNSAWGAEWRLENYISKLGEEASWKNYDPVNYPQFREVASENALNKNRNVFGAYVEMETEFAKRLLLNMATRYEYYNDFGGNLGAKFASIYNLSNKFSLRASVNNGFRAPSLQQRYVTSIQIANMNSGGILIPVNRGLFANNHFVTKAFGIPSLTAEKTINISGGITAAVSKNINLMIDAYWIQIKNRIILSGTLNRSNPDVRKILDSIPGIRIDQVQFFMNAINTKTKGLDIVLNGKWKINRGILGFMFAGNFTTTRLFGKIKATEKLPVDSLNTNSLFNKEELTKLEKGQPANKLILTVTWEKGKTNFILSNTLFGRTAIAPFNSVAKQFLYETFSPKILTDFSINYSLKSWMTITTGANNIFDIYPDRIMYYENTLQGIYLYSPEASPFGFNGGYYYLSMKFDFPSKNKKASR